MINIDRKPFVGLIKKTLRKLGWLALRNEIEATNAWICDLLVSRTPARIYADDGTNFILARHPNF